MEYVVTVSKKCRGACHCTGECTNLSNRDKIKALELEIQRLKSNPALLDIKINPLLKKDEFAFVMPNIEE